MISVLIPISMLILWSSIDEMNVYETSYIKLREVSLTFTLPKSLISPMKLKGASISLIGRNFLLWSTLPNVRSGDFTGYG